MVHLARAGGPHPVSLNSLRSPLFTTDTVEIQPVTEYTDLSPEWGDISTLDMALPTTPEPGWSPAPDNQSTT